MTTLPNPTALDVAVGLHDVLEWVVGPSCRPDALMHLTAVPAPGIVPDHLTFMSNIAWTWVSSARPGVPVNS
jgi:hypothetical protein